ncbi:MAG TPA: subclass B1 metallo-beta-lactamase, partial [Pelobium sp.]
MKLKTLVCLFVLLITIKVNAQERAIDITKISPKTFVHESFLQTKDWGKVSCNGLIFINDHKALVFDTPANEEATTKLINIIQDSLKAEIVGVVINHFHADCLAGLKVFHKLHIPSYASRQTIALATAKGYEAPRYGFKSKQVLTVGGKKIKNYYFGGAH